MAIVQRIIHSRHIPTSTPYPLAQQRVSLLRLVVPDRDRHRLFGPDNDDELLPPRDAGIEEVALEEDVVLGQDRDDHGRVLGALRFVDGNGVGVDQLVELGEVVGDLPAVEAEGVRSMFSADDSA